MDSTTLIPWVRKEATLSQYSTEYTSVVILQMLNFTMTDVFEPVISSTRSGYWLHTFTRELGVGNASVRLPHRATPAIEQIDISDDGINWVALDEALEAEQQDWMRDYKDSLYPRGYTIRGSYINLIPAAKVEGIYLRLKTTVRPSTIVEAQSAGKITAVDYDTGILTVNSLPQSKPDNTTISGAVLIDCIEAKGNFERSLLDAQATVLDATHVQVAPDYSVQRVAIGDYVRVAEQSDWPQLPAAFHKLVGSITAIPICTQRDLHERSAELSTQSSNSLGRLVEHLRPRIRVQQHKPLQHNWSD